MALAHSKPADLDVMMQLVARVAEASAQDPLLESAELQELKRHVAGKRAILSGTLNGQPVIFRIFLDPQDETPIHEWDEMTRVWPQMCEAPYRIAKPLHYAPAHGILVLEEISGTPLMQHIWRTNPEEREVFLRPAAEWLRAYTSGTENHVQSRAGLWLDKAEKAAARQPHPRLQRRERKILKELHRLAAFCDQTGWRTAISHGDYHPNNLIWREGCFTGIDMGGSSSMPIYKDMARFLMHMGRRGLIPSGEAQFGVDAKGMAAFADAFDLSHTERDLILPFMLGVEALLRVEHAGIKRGRVRRAAEMSDLLIADLAQI